MLVKKPCRYPIVEDLFLPVTDDEVEMVEAVDEAVDEAVVEEEEEEEEIAAPQAVEDGPRANPLIRMSDGGSGIEGRTTTVGVAASNASSRRVEDTRMRSVSGSTNRTPSGGVLAWGSRKRKARVAAPGSGESAGEGRERVKKRKVHPDMRDFIVSDDDVVGGVGEVEEVGPSGSEESEPEGSEDRVKRWRSNSLT